MQTESSENGFKVETFDNGDEKASHVIGTSPYIGRGHLTHQSQVPVVFIIFKVFVWIGGNNMKTLVWMKIFCFVFAKMKTGTF